MKMSDEPIRISNVCSATNWWLEINFVGDKKIVRRLPIAAWALTGDGGFKAICFDAGQAFYAESDDELEISYKYGPELNQIGDGIPLDDEKPKRTKQKRKK